MVNDTIADFLTRIRNSMTRDKKELTLPSSNILESIAKILKEEGFILDYTVKKFDREVKKENEGQKAISQNKITIKLKYVNGRPAIYKLERISKPGIRQYMGYRDIPRVKRDIGISIFSTPKGIMTGENAKQAQVGGEYLCRIW